MSNISQQFQLVFEPALVATSAEFLPLPSGVSFLLAPLTGSPQFLAVPPESFDDTLIVESLVNPNRQLRLMILNPAAGRLLVNGQVVPRVALLRERDEFSLNHGVSLFVTLWRQPRIGPPDATLIGKPCGICRVPFSPDTRVCHCQCGNGLHCELREDKTEPLQCLSLTDACPRCHAAHVTSPGFAWLPEFCHA